jgi:NAD kinase
VKNATWRGCASLSREDFDSIDLVITIGGDGVLIKTASFIKNQPILGINSEPEYSEGALTSIHDSEIEELKQILNGNYKIKELERIEVILNNKNVGLAINEVYIGSSIQFHTSRYVISFKDKKEEQRSSGVLITTSSGSHAWYKSAGGVPFEDKNKLKFIIREAYIGKRVFKPTLLSGEINPGDAIKIEGKRHGGGIIAVDSDSVFDFNNNDKAEIKLSNNYLRVLVKNPK